MLIYCILLAFVTGVALLDRRYTLPSKNLVGGKRPGLLAVLLIIGAFSLIVCTRDGVGTDFGNYKDVWLVTVDKPYSTLWANPEPLFGVLLKWCDTQFHTDTSMFVVCGLLTMICVVYALRECSELFPLSIFLFIAGMYYFDAANGMRQMLATAILMVAYSFMLHRNWIAVLLLTLVAWGFHASSPVVLLIFLYARWVKPTSGINLAVMLVFLAAYVFYNNFLDLLLDFLVSSDSIYVNYESMLSQTDAGANFLRFALAAVPPVLYYFTRNHIPSQRSDLNTLVNLSLINALFMLLATRHWIFARMCMFLGVYNILLWPKLLKAYEPRSRQFVTLGVAVVYFLYFYLIVQVDSNLLPYKSFLFEGVWR